MLRWQCVNAAAIFVFFSTIFVSTGHANASGLVAFYTFNGTLADSSGHGKTAKDSGVPTFVANAPFGGKAISFDGTGHAIVSAPLNISVANLPRLTMGAWVLAKSFAAPPYGIMSNDNGNYDRTIDIDNRSAPKVTWSAFVGGAVVGSVPIIANKWYFVAVSYDNAPGPGSYVFYVNDGAKTTVLGGADAFDADSVTTSVTIGANPGFDQAFAGDVANAFFYSGVLTKSQIDAIIARGPKAIPGLP
jgi:concanavalin A-like lectin/glucanase superfamily protein